MPAAGTTQRGVLAWFAAWLLVAVLGWGAEQIDDMLGAGGAWAPSYLGLWLAPSALAFIIWMPFARAKKWPRPLTDTIVFALGAAAAPLLFLLAVTIRGEAYANIRFLDGMSAAEYAFYVARVSTAFGLLGGMLYWLFAGRPRPPYR